MRYMCHKNTKTRKNEKCSAKSRSFWLIALHISQNKFSLFKTIVRAIFKKKSDEIKKGRNIRFLTLNIRPMVSITEILDAIFGQIGETNKCRIKFFKELFVLIFSIQGRVNFENLSRYSKLNECSFRRHFEQFFDWLNFNLHLFNQYGRSVGGEVIAAIDCSFIPKSGKKTFGLDKFWSGTASRSKRGLEISVLCLIDVLSGGAWTLDATQTPSKLNKEEDGKYSRIDFYLEQISDCFKYLKGVVYFVADGFYAKTKVFDFLCQNGKHLITKLRPDANLRYLFEGTHTEGKRGPKTKYDGKVDYKDLSRWNVIGPDTKYSYLQLYSKVVNAPAFERNLLVIIVLNTKTNKYILLACSDIDLCPRLVLTYYQLRFQIEFIFRDAKQFTGLCHSQARDEDKLDFHFNMSLSAINIARATQKLNPDIKSMNSFVRRAYNLKLVNWLFTHLSKNAEFDLFHPDLDKVLSFGAINPT
jgi:hypothetical protein